jgi:hypothetical protein
VAGSPAVRGRDRRLKGYAAGSGHGPRSSRGCIKPPGQRRVLGDHGLDLRSVAGVEVVAEGAEFALLGLDLGQPAGIGVCSVQRPRSRLRPVSEKCAQNVLGDFRADSVGEHGGHFLQCLLGLQTRGQPEEPEGVGLRRLRPTKKAESRGRNQRIATDTAIKYLLDIDIILPVLITKQRPFHALKAFAPTR